MGRQGGAYKSEKRKKELSRIKKQEQKRQKRMGKISGPQDETDLTASGDAQEATATGEEGETQQNSD